MQFYGWYQWTRGRSSTRARCRRSQRLGPRGWTCDDRRRAGAGTAALGTAMHRYTNAALPYPDAFTTLLSVFAQFLMTKKFLENWTLWIIADIVYIGVYAIKVAVLDVRALRGLSRAVRAGLSRVERQGSAEPASAIVVVIRYDRPDEGGPARRRHDRGRAVNGLPDDLVQLQVGRHIGVAEVHPQRRRGAGRGPVVLLVERHVRRADA